MILEQFWSASSTANPPMPTHRQRSRKACQPCRQRKRKCDGHKPCTTCVRYDYDCYYSASERHSYDQRQDTDREPISPNTTSSDHSRQNGQPGMLDPFKNRFVNASSAIAFPRLLAIELNSSNAPRLHSFAWNLGIRSDNRVEEADFTQYLSFNELQRLSEVYFTAVHPIFEFINREDFESQYQARYKPKCKDRSIDPVVCGIAALGSLFSIGSLQSSHPHESELVELGISILSHTSTIGSPTQDHVAAWILRTLYLRSTTKPHASWLSSCTTMHLIEAMALQQEVNSIAFVSPAAPEIGAKELDTRRRIFWVSKSLNSIIAYEYGRSRVELPNANIEPISLDEDSLSTPTHQYIALANLLPCDEPSPRHTEAHRSLFNALSSLTKLNTVTDEIKLLKADLAFCLYRRLRLSLVPGSGIPAETTSLIINLGLQALPSSSTLAARHIPWWTVISVPFQLVCVLLAIDSRESLSHIAEAMGILEEIGTHWDTHMVREAAASAGLLVRLSRKRKEEDLRWLDGGMPQNSGPNGHIQSQTADIIMDGDDENDMANFNGTLAPQDLQIPARTTPINLNWADGLDVNLPTDYTIDWDNFFSNVDWPQLQT